MGGAGQIATGGIMAVGLIEGRGGLNWRLMIRIFFGWGMTIIFTAVTCGCMVAFCVNGPERMGTNRRVGLAKTLTADAELYASLLNSTRSVATADLAVPDSEMFPYPAREPRPALLPAWLRRGLNLDRTSPRRSAHNSPAAWPMRVRISLICSARVAPRGQVPGPRHVQATGGARGGRDHLECLGRKRDPEHDGQGGGAVLAAGALRGDPQLHVLPRLRGAGPPE